MFSVSRSHKIIRCGLVCFQDRLIGTILKYSRLRELYSFTAELQHEYQGAEKRGNSGFAALPHYTTRSSSSYILRSTSTMISVARRPVCNTNVKASAEEANLTTKRTSGRPILCCKLAFLTRGTMVKNESCNLGLLKSSSIVAPSAKGYDRVISCGAGHSTRR